MRLLILGGTVFLGRALVDSALGRGHSLTLFNRGKSSPGLYTQVEQLHGDRSILGDGGLAILQGRSWDAVIDTCGYIPRIVRQSAQLLASHVERYIFVSTLSVYADSRVAGIAEDYPLAKLAGPADNPSTEQVTGESYGPLKALCEKSVQNALPGRALIVRPGLIVGPNDPSDRFSYWPVRVARGGEMLVPGRPERTVQFIDVRDLADWMIRMAEADNTGVYNADGLGGQISMGSLLDTCRHERASSVDFTWVSETFLEEQRVGPWQEMPLWIPESDPDSVGFFYMSVSKALAAGLSFRPLAETVADTLAWASQRPAEHAWRAGLKPERETELLALWKQYQEQARQEP